MIIRIIYTIKQKLFQNAKNTYFFIYHPSALDIFITISVRLSLYVLSLDAYLREPLTQTHKHIYILACVHV